MLTTHQQSKELVQSVPPSKVLDLRLLHELPHPEPNSIKVCVRRLPAPSGKQNLALAKAWRCLPTSGSHPCTFQLVVACAVSIQEVLSTACLHQQCKAMLHLRRNIHCIDHSAGSMHGRCCEQVSRDCAVPTSKWHRLCVGGSHRTMVRHRATRQAVRGSTTSMWRRGCACD